MKLGKFITLEGGEGVGKSTNVHYIQTFLKSQGIDVIVTREPGGTKLAEKIRTFLLQRDHDESISPQAELLLMFAGRSLHLENIIKPNLQQGKWVVCDRFTDASYAYQGSGRGIDEQTINWLESFIQEGLQPDLTLLLDMPVAEGMHRANKRSEPDRFETEHLVFFDRVRAGYLSRAEQFPQRIKIIRAQETLSEVQMQIQVELQSLLTA